LTSERKVRGPIFWLRMSRSQSIRLLVGQPDALALDLIAFSVAHLSPAPMPLPVRAYPKSKICTGEMKDLGCQKAALPAQSAVEGRLGSEL
jgi:hypothetical protein